MRYSHSARSWFSVRGVFAGTCWGLAIILLGGADCCVPDSSSDRVEFENTLPGEEWGVLIDGTTVGGSVDDRIDTGSVAELVLENFQTGPDSEEEVIAVTRGRALELVENAPWTDAEGDLVRIDFDPVIEIPVTIWIVTAPFIPNGFDHALEQVLVAHSLWQQERMGIRFGAIEIVDATGNADAGGLTEFECDFQKELEDTIGNQPEHINVYRVMTVHGHASWGESCALGSGFVALGESAATDILAHEIGHSFGLEHPDQPSSGLGNQNLMAPLSSVREFLTEGQVFRAHVDPSSVINSLYEARSGKPLRSCGHTDANQSCPGLATRIWPDLPSQSPSGAGLSPAEPGAPEPASSEPPPPEELTRSWLLRNCEMGTIDLHRHIRTRADAVAEVLLAAFHRGPPVDLVAKAETGARARFELRQRALSDPGALGLSDLDLARLAEVSEADYVARELNTVQRGYRTQALRGLLVARPDRARPLLLREAADPGSPLRDVAARLLEHNFGP